MSATVKALRIVASMLERSPYVECLAGSAGGFDALARGGTEGVGVDVSAW